MRSKKKIIKKLVIAILIIAAVLAAAFKLYSLNYYRADNKTIEKIEKSDDVAVKKYNGDTLLFYPKNNESVKAGIVFYPGGKVDYRAYSGFMYKLAERGFVCLLPRMLENLAFLNIDKADDLKLESLNVKKWYIAGHSLGGVAAGKYLSDKLSDDESEFSGLILCASYTTSDLTGYDINTLSIYGSNDGILNMSKYKENKKNLPDLTEKVIDGGIHSYFGSYGHQSGDGKSSISNEEQLDAAADIILKWVDDNNN